MTKQVLIFFIFLLFVSHSICEETLESELNCRRINAVQTTCATECEINRCPVAEVYNVSCEKPAKCVAGCQCKFNEKFATNGTCIPTTECPSFKCDRPNEEYVACPPYCSEQCSEAKPSGRCLPTFGLILMVEECFPKCRCKEGHWRKSGNCVPYAECLEKR